MGEPRGSLGRPPGGVSTSDDHVATEGDRPTADQEGERRAAAADGTLRARGPALAGSSRQPVVKIPMSSKLRARNAGPTRAWPPPSTTASRRPRPTGCRPGVARAGRALMLLASAFRRPERCRRRKPAVAVTDRGHLGWALAVRQYLHADGRDLGTDPTTVPDGRHAGARQPGRGDLPAARRPPCVGGWRSAGRLNLGSG